VLKRIFGLDVEAEEDSIMSFLSLTLHQIILE